MKFYQKSNLLAISLLIAMVFALLMLSGCTESAVTDVDTVYMIDGNVHSLNIKVNAAEFVIRDSDTFCVVSNLKYLSVDNADGVLTITEETKLGVSYEEPFLTLFMPTDTLFERIQITTGASKLTASELNADVLVMKLGAGDISIAKLHVTTDAKINGGAGKVTISDGSVHDLELEMGVGELNLAATLLGNCDLSLGVGRSNLQLLGSKDIYKIDIEKGLGQVTVDGAVLEEHGVIGNGTNSIDIEGGIGAINIRFSA